MQGYGRFGYYGSEPAFTCYVKNQNKLIWSDILKRDEVERVDAECSGLSKRKCKGDCEWVTSNEQSEAETRTLHYKKALTENTCRSKLLTDTTYGDAMMWKNYIGKQVASVGKGRAENA